MEKMEPKVKNQWFSNSIVHLQKERKYFYPSLISRSGKDGLATKSIFDSKSEDPEGNVKPLSLPCLEHDVKFTKM